MGNVTPCCDPPTPPASSVHLWYFEGYGRAEPIRWLLAASELQWTAHDMENRAQMVDLMSSGKLAFGQVPLLEIDGLNLTQSQAILRYLAKRGGLRGRTPAEEFKLDMIADTVNDCRNQVLGFPFMPDPARFIADKVRPAAAKYLDKFEMLACEIAGTPWFLLSGMSYADVVMAELLDWFAQLLPGCLDASDAPAYPNLTAMYEGVKQIPGIIQYLESDKRYPFPFDQEGKAYVSNVNLVLAR